jgi:Spherulation-specific family 4
VDRVIRVTAIASGTAATTLLAATVLAARGPEKRTACVDGLVPAYLPPRAITALAGSPHLPRLLVVNPASGPGAGPQPPFKDAVLAAQLAGARVLGYVHTGWGARDAGDVRRDIDRYAQWYGTDGVFLDEAAHDAASAPLYGTYAVHARADGDGFVALNPGVVPARAYFGFADVVVTFEGSVADYEDRLAAMPAWLGQVPPDRIAHLVYGATREQALAVAHAKQHPGRLYVTSGMLPDPWSALPDYLAEEQAALEGCA